MSDTDDIAKRDQIETAERETRALTERIIGGGEGGAHVTVSSGAHGVDEIGPLAKWLASLDPVNGPLGCEHVANPTALIGLLAVPNALFCLPCGGRMDSVLLEGRAGLCDSCNEPSDKLVGMYATEGVLSIAGRICEACREGVPV